MADDNTPAREIITPEMFRDKAESAGKKLESRLRGDLHTGKQTDQLVSFRWEPYEDVLNDVMTAFETKVGHIALVRKEPNVTENSSADSRTTPPRPHHRVAQDLPNDQGCTIRRGSS
jgi:hypothetical protein